MWVDAPTGRQHFCGLVIRTHLEAIITSRRFQSAPQPQNPPPTPADLKGCAALRWPHLQALSVLGGPLWHWLSGSEPPPSTVAHRSEGRCE